MKKFFEKSLWFIIFFSFMSLSLNISSCSKLPLKLFITSSIRLESVKDSLCSESALSNCMKTIKASNVLNAIESL